MTEQESHMKDILDKQEKLMEEMKKIQSQIMAKQEEYLKLQGIVEYLVQQGVPMPDVTPNGMK